MLLVSRLQQRTREIIIFAFLSVIPPCFRHTGSPWYFSFLPHISNLLFWFLGWNVFWLIPNSSFLLIQVFSSNLDFFLEYLLLSVSLLWTNLHWIQGYIRYSTRYVSFYTVFFFFCSPSSILKTWLVSWHTEPQEDLSQWNQTEPSRAECNEEDPRNVFEFMPSWQRSSLTGPE